MVIQRAELETIRKEVPEETWDAWNAVFDRLDTSGDGVMSAKELRPGFRGCRSEVMRALGFFRVFMMGLTRVLQAAYVEFRSFGDFRGFRVKAAGNEYTRQAIATLNPDTQGIPNPKHP